MRISASNKPTSQKAFHDIVAIKVEIESLLKYKPSTNSSSNSIASETERILYDMAVKMKAKYDKYFASLEDCNQLLFVALVLNQRHKLRNFEFHCNKWLHMESQEIKKKSCEIKELLVKLCDLYGVAVAVSSNTSRSKSGESTVSQRNKGSKKALQPSGIIADMEEDWERELECSEEAVVGNEVDRYIIDPLEKSLVPKQFVVLDWWRRNSEKYPTLVVVANDVFAIQISIVASECCFSIGKRVIDPFRSSLSPKTVEALICYQNWIRDEKLMEIQYVPTPEHIQLYEDVEDEIKSKTKSELSMQPSKTPHTLKLDGATSAKDVDSSSSKK